jgi:hypothetical protein
MVHYHLCLQWYNQMIVKQSVFLKLIMPNPQLDYSELTVIVSEYVLYFTLINISLIACA